MLDIENSKAIGDEAVPVILQCKGIGESFLLGTWHFFSSAKLASYKENACQLRYWLYIKHIFGRICVDVVLFLKTKIRFSFFNYENKSDKCFKKLKLKLRKLLFYHI